METPIRQIYEETVKSYNNNMHPGTLSTQWLWKWPWIIYANMQETDKFSTNLIEITPGEYERRIKFNDLTKCHSTRLLLSGLFFFFFKIKDSKPQSRMHVSLITS